MDSLEMEEAAFRGLRPRLLRSCAGEFVAVYHGRVVGRGPDDEALAHEMFAKLRDVAFYIAKVEATPTVYELPSPESLR
jgi:hypothetical protein